MKDRRSDRVIMTNEAKVLKQMREQKGLSMRQAGKLLNRSDAYISHIENGRMDIPKGDKLDRILNLYGPLKQKSFFERARQFKAKTTPKDELSELIAKLNDEQVKITLQLTKSILNSN